MNGPVFKALPSFVLAMALLAGCSSAPPAKDADSASSSGPSPEAAQGAVPQRSRSASVLPPHLDKAHPITDKRSVYFDLADHSLPPEAVALLQLHGMYLAAHPGIHIRIEGHTDELGGTEYNLALGQRRADSVANALKVMGVPESQLETVSFGKEKPRALGHDEDSWAVNRRADLVYPAD